MTEAMTGLLYINIFCLLLSRPSYLYCEHENILSYLYHMPHILRPGLLLSYMPNGTFVHNRAKIYWSIFFFRNEELSPGLCYIGLSYVLWLSIGSVQLHLLIVYYDCCGLERMHAKHVNIGCHVRVCEKSNKNNSHVFG
jgi:hypothetical protein